MRISLLATLAALSCASTSSAALIAAWNQDETSGGIVDSTGGHPVGVATGTVDYGQAGVPNGTYGAIAITAAAGTSLGYGPSTVDEYFTVGTDNNNPVMNISRTGTMTVMGWVNPNAHTAGVTYRFLSTGSSLGSDRGWGIGLRYDAADNTAKVRFTNYGVLDTDSGTFTAAPGTWVHLAVTYNNGAINYFVNGVQTGAQVTSLFGDELAGGRLVIGGRLGGNDVDQMNGLVDGIRVYDTVLSAGDIQLAAIASVSVPEPAMGALALLGAGLGLRRRRK